MRTPAAEQPGGFSHAVRCTSRLKLAMPAVVAHDDARAGREADLKGDQRGRGLAGLRKRKLAAQRLLVLLVGLAHNVLLWARQWLGPGTARLARLGIVRLVQEVWAVPGRVKVSAGGLRRVRLKRAHPRARAVCRGLRPLLAPSQTLGLLG